MAAMTKLLLAVFVIQVSLIYLGIATIPGTTLYNFITNPSSWETSPFSLLISDLLLTVGGLAIVAGTFLIKNDLLVFAGMASVFFTFGKPLVDLWSIISAQTNEYVAIVVVSPIILIYSVTVIAWWRGRD